MVENFDKMLAGSLQPEESWYIQEQNFMRKSRQSIYTLA